MLTKRVLPMLRIDGRAPGSIPWAVGTETGVYRQRPTKANTTRAVNTTSTTRPIQKVGTPSPPFLGNWQRLPASGQSDVGRFDLPKAPRLVCAAGMPIRMKLARELTVGARDLVRGRAHAETERAQVALTRRLLALDLNANDQGPARLPRFEIPIGLLQDTPETGARCLSFTWMR